MERENSENEIKHFLRYTRENARSRGDKPAAEGMGESYTYAELDRISDAVGQRLMGLGVGRGDVVLIESRRHVNVFPAIMGIWKARAVFAYVDTKAPPYQRAMITSSCRCVRVLGEEEIAEVRDSVRAGRVTPELPVGELEDAAWVLMTSGTTGTPKSVLVSHLNIAHAIAASSATGLRESDRQSMIASFSFMSSLIEAFPILAVGGTVEMIPQEARRDLSAIAGFLEKERISVCFLPAHFAERFVRSGLGAAGLRLLLTGGEPVHQLKKCGFDICCGYGSSETCGPATLQRVGYEAEDYPIGRPLPSVRLYLLDENMKPVTTPGELGELCFAGPTVCMGYSGNPELTAKRFVKNPFSREKGYERLYKSGDMARMDEKGEYYFVCRRDMMCKVSGFRIELGEMEAAIADFVGIERSVVEPLRGVRGEKALHAFYCSARRIDEAALAEFLRRRLLHYKVPAFFHRLETMPVSDNGKINRDAIIRYFTSLTEPKKNGAEWLSPTKK